ncbi:hypothetical protein [Pseudomonas coleopterorum]|uniref:hypothetical protein n=1 Tax=Pseudomonas coleopterorum TaxID=1605838 RepID=UPI00177C9172|nr:hypothetical protein [Pseudomonas coleopterorum]MBD8483930.1 hypothetical protein [Pseudomonas coleopterorum]
MLSLKASTLAMCVVASVAIGAAGSMVVMKMTSSANADASASLTCQPTTRPAETFRHADPVNTGRNKEY